VAAAVALCRRIREEIDFASAGLGEPVQVVLRGVSTLRGHVFAETDVLARGRLGGSLVVHATCLPPDSGSGGDGGATGG
jgi:hypothetical protein